MSARLFFSCLLSAATLLIVCRTASSSEMQHEPFCYAILPGGVMKDLDSVCQGEQAPALEPAIPKFNEEASRLYQDAYCDALKHGISPSLAIAEADFTAKLHHEMNGMNSKSFKPPVALKRQVLSQKSC